MRLLSPPPYRYVFFRLHQLLYERLYEFKTLATAIHQSRAGVTGIPVSVSLALRIPCTYVYGVSDVIVEGVVTS